MSGSRFDPRFYVDHGPLTLGDIAALTGADLHASAASVTATGVAPFEDARPGEITFADGDVVKRIGASAATACFVATGKTPEASRNGPALLTCDDPRAAFSIIARAFHAPLSAPPGVHATAFVGDGARLGADVSVGANAVIEDEVVLGDGVVVGAGAVVARGCRVGARSRISAGAVVAFTNMGEDCVVGFGAALGEAGFGFALERDGLRRAPQFGRVVVGDRVEIGANAAVDRGALGDTILEDDVKIDNLVQVAHTCVIEKGAILTGQVGLAGSSRIGAGAMLGGQAGIADHVTIGAGARVGAQSGVMRDVPAGAAILGSPARPAKAYFREVSALTRLAAKKGKGREG